jgi:hypothetical protein
MVWFLRILLVCLIVCLFCFLFLSAFGKAIWPEHSETNGLIIGLLSALAWGLSVVGERGWNGWFNFFAALFAAVSLGFLTPTKDICPGETRTISVCTSSAWAAGLVDQVVSVFHGSHR